MALSEEVQKHRKADYPIQDYILNRWSPRAMSGEPLSDEEIMTIFEAARWAPSSYNNQPWRFIYAKRDTEHWQTLFDLMGEFNQSWAKNAGVLVVVVSAKNFEYNAKPSVTHAFDTGAAWENLALQTNSMGLVAHGMEGFDYDKAKQVLGVPDDYEVYAMIALGRPGKIEDLPQDLQEKEKPSERKSLDEIIMEGVFKN